MATKKPAELSDEEVLLQLEAEKEARAKAIAEARENLAKYGTAIAPVGVKVELPAFGGVVRIAPRSRAQPIDPKWFKVTKVCPHCGEEKNVGRDFGVIWRKTGDTRKDYAAGWCRSCRSATSNGYLEGKKKKK